MKWKKLSLEEKVDDLCKDLVIAMASVNMLVRDHAAFRLDLTSLGVELKHLTERLARLEMKAQDKGQEHSDPPRDQEDDTSRKVRRF
jgi:hypothetical protein